MNVFGIRQIDTGNVGLTCQDYQKQKVKSKLFAKKIQSLLYLYKNFRGEKCSKNSEKYSISDTKKR